MDVSTQPASLYLEDFTAGMTFRSAEIEVSLDEIVRFARQYDPQPFHLDAEAARSTFFGRLVASGWHTAALTMRLLVQSDFSIAGGIVGAGGEIKWPAAMLPDDRIHLEIEVVATRPLRSRPELGMITTRTLTVNERGTVVQELQANLFVPRRPVSGDVRSR